MSANAPSISADPVDGRASPHGDAAAAAAAIDAWLGERDRRPEQDWEGLLTAIADRLREIRAAPVVRDDAVILGIFDDMLYARNMQELAADIDRLCDRVAHVLAHPEDVEPVPASAAQPEVPGAKKVAGRVKLRL
ncbi:hypothetical protein ACUSIJ_07550 [Pseudochelatococcus sp. B33]